VDLAGCARRDGMRAGGGGRLVRLGRAARRHAAQLGRRADRGASRHRVPARAAASHPPVHLRLRAGRGPSRHRHRRGDPAVLRRGGVRRAQPPTAPAPGDPPGRGRGRGCARVRRQRGGGPLPHQDRAPDRLRRAGRRRPARPHRRLYLAGRAGRSGRGGDRLDLGRPGRGLAHHGGDPGGGMAGGPRGRPPADGQRRPGPDREGRGDLACHSRRAGRRPGAAALGRPYAPGRVRDRCRSARLGRPGARHRGPGRARADPRGAQAHRRVGARGPAGRHRSSRTASRPCALRPCAGEVRPGAGCWPAARPSGWPRTGRPRSPRRGTGRARPDPPPGS